MKKEKPVLLIMAAGMGSRYGGLKQIDKITQEGEIILDFSLFDAKKAGFEKVIFIIRKETEEDFRQLLNSGAAKHMEIEYVYQDINNIPKEFSVPEGRVKPWGTGHAILSAYDSIKGPFAVINADDYYGESAFKDMYDFLEDTQEGKFAMVSYELKNTVTENGSVSRGVCQVENGFLEDVVERKTIEKHGEKIEFLQDEQWIQLDEDIPVSMNFWGYSSMIMEELKKEFPRFLKKAMVDNPKTSEFYIPSVTDKLIKTGLASCKVLISKDKWYGITYKEDKEAVKEAIQKMKKDGKYPKKLW